MRPARLVPAAPLLLLLLLAAPAAPVAALECVVETPHGTVDLAPVSLAQLTIPQVGGGGGAYDWSLSLCERRPPLLGKQCARQPAFLYRYPPGGAACLDSVDSPSGDGFAYDAARRALRASYRGTAEVTVEVACGPSRALEPAGPAAASLLPSGVRRWAIPLHARAACGNGSVPSPQPTPAPPAPAPGEAPVLGPGLLFIAAAAAGLLSYCAGGVLYNRCCLRRPCGWPAVPNGEFWRSSPGLFADGVVWAWDAVRCRTCGRQRRHGPSGGYTGL